MNKNNIAPSHEFLLAPKRKKLFREALNELKNNDQFDAAINSFLSLMRLNSGFILALSLSLSLLSLQGDTQNKKSAKEENNSAHFYFLLFLPSSGLAKQ